jgi:hypothetical protein
VILPRSTVTQYVNSALHPALSTCPEDVLF